MGLAATIFKVMPESPEVDLDKLMAEIKEAVKPQDMKKVPVAFGLNALEVMIVKEDKEGAPKEEEEKMKALDGVQSVEISGVTLL